MERLDAITWPRPLAELLDACHATYLHHHPWVRAEPSPKSILREMLESGDSFATFVGRYRLERSEGLVLRYLTDAWRTLDRSLPDAVYCAELEDVVEWLGELIRATDATLLDEWARLAGAPAARPSRPRGAGSDAALATRCVAHGGPHGGVRVGGAAGAPRDGAPWPSGPGGASNALTEAMADYWAEYDAIAIDADARSAAHVAIAEEPDRWVVTQRLVDPAGDGEWRFVAVVDLVAAKAEGAPTLRLEHLGRL